MLLLFITSLILPQKNGKCHSAILNMWQTMWFILHFYHPLVELTHICAWRQQSVAYHIANMIYITVHPIRPITNPLSYNSSFLPSPLLTHQNRVTNVCISTRPSSIQILACYLVSAEPLSEPMLVYYWLDPLTHMNVSSWNKFRHRYVYS